MKKKKGTKTVWTSTSCIKSTVPHKPMRAHTHAHTCTHIIQTHKMTFTHTRLRSSCSLGVVVKRQIWPIPSAFRSEVLRFHTCSYTQHNTKPGHTAHATTRVLKEPSRKPTTSGEQCNSRVTRPYMRPSRTVQGYMTSRDGTNSGDTHKRVLSAMDPKRQNTMKERNKRQRLSVTDFHILTQSTVPRAKVFKEIEG